MATAASPTHATPLLTPLNLLLFALVVLVVYLRIRPRPPMTLPAAPPPIVFRTFTPPTLAPFNGRDDPRIYFAVRGRVFDVTAGKNFYGPGGPYENFAGRDASRGLACHSFEEDMLTKDLEGPLDDLRDLGEEEMESLGGWEQQFLGKYLVVGKLVAVGSEEARRAEKAGGA